MRRALFRGGGRARALQGVQKHAPRHDAAVSPCTGAVACVAESHGLLLYDVRANRAVRTRGAPAGFVAMRGDARRRRVRRRPARRRVARAGARAETFAVGLRDGTLAFVDSARRPSYVTARGDALKAAGGFSFVTDLVALRETPGMLVAASADGGLRVWDARATRARRRACWRGSAGTRLRHQAAMRGGRARAVRGVRPDAPRARGRGAAVHRARGGGARGVGPRGGDGGVAARRVAPPGASAEVASAVAVETEPGVRVWAGTRERLRLYVPKQTLGPGGTPASGSGVSRRRAFYVARQLVLDRILRRYASGLLAHFLRRRNLAHSAWHFG